MSQLNWTLLDDFGQQFKIGLYHGDSTGHLIVYCNWRIIIIDFNVLASKDYAFYLGEELCTLKVNAENGCFNYSFTTDRQTETRLNVHRKQIERIDLFKSIGFVMVVILTISIIVLFM